MAKYTPKTGTTTRTPKINPVTDDMGRKGCPLCSTASKFVPLKDCKGSMANRAMGCSNNVYDFKTRTASGCSYLHWLENAFVRTAPEVERPATWPNISRRTAEQLALRKALALTPKAANRSRCVIVNAVPGSGKSTSMADDCEVIALRATVRDWYLTAFNTNAKESLLAKIPAAWPNIQTINGFGGRIQGFSRQNYKPGKVGSIFRELIADIEPKKRPSSAGIKAFAERMRDLLLIRDDTNPGAWSSDIATIMERFPALDKPFQKNGETIKEYIPRVLTASMAQRSVIDLTEQYARPALNAIYATGWKQRPELCQKSHEWTESDLEHLCTLIRAINVPQVAGCIVDEAQDLSLSQIVLFLAATFRTGELILVGDDKDGEPGESNYKAGQAIFGWRGAFPCSLKLVARLWRHLTGETPENMPLSITFRCPPEHCDAVRPLNAVMQSAKPYGSGEVASVAAATAFDRWLNIPETNLEGKPFSALWICRRNAPLADLFMSTLRSRKQVALRGGKDMEGAIDSALSEPAGWRDQTSGEYRVGLNECLNKLRQLTADASADGEGQADDMQTFLLEIGEALQAEPSLLAEAKDDQGRALSGLTVGNLRRFVLYFASKTAPRTLSTVYRSKGDEADLVIVDDCEMLNMAWNGDEDEARACRHVACTRSRQSLLIVGQLDGVIIPSGSGELALDAPEVAKPTPATKPAPVAAPVVTAATVKPLALSLPATDAKPAKPKTVRKPRAKKPTGGSLFGDEHPDD